MGGGKQKWWKAVKKQNKQIREKNAWSPEEESRGFMQVAPRSELYLSSGCVGWVCSPEAETWLRPPGNTGTGVIQLWLELGLPERCLALLFAPVHPQQHRWILFFFPVLELEKRSDSITAKHQQIVTSYNMYALPLSQEAGYEALSAFRVSPIN